MNKAGYILIILGFFIMLCAAGGSDLERLTGGEIALRLFIGLGLMIAGDILRIKKEQSAAR